ncbi:hypothetical protein OIDMADRAFT_149569 [Oidiodendron maius Zn]|uniref:Zn(2)-C6 fungal-type domain-containing protein n=1 Tax=Oidiodendron maius (strain Zn) TaxID=913774 RepID=A0A0C3CVR7_OIDMZ|nr:hypothetical protein OIDMADRAFT_149569 [Oidiodendron maius Zn]
MFSNFEVCKAGLVRVEVKQKQHRTTTGCLECRRRKKKCDEQLPICGGCAKGQVDLFNITCTRPQYSSPLPSPSREARSMVQLLDELLPLQSPSSPFVIGTLATSNESLPSYLTLMGEGEPMAIYPNQRGSTLNHSASAHAFQSMIALQMINPRANLESPFFTVFSETIERKALQSLTTKFDSMVTPTYINPELSILVHGLPLAIHYPAVKNAFTACGLALLFKETLNANDYQTSLKYYNKAINIVATELMTLPEESNISAALLLHIFESLVMSAFSRAPPLTVHQILLLEAYIYRVVVSSIFSGIESAPLPDTYVQNLLRILYESSERLQPGPTWRLSALIGSVIQSESHGSIPENHPPEQMTITTQLYLLASSLLLQKVQHLSLAAQDALPQSIMQTAVVLFPQLPNEDLVQPILTWPSLILGTAAITPSDRAMFIALFEASMRKKDSGSATQASQILKKCWEIDPSTGSELGMDILLRNDLLRTVFL